MDLLKPGNEVFKLIGPVLVKQDLVEAKENVTKRMEYISSEMLVIFKHLYIFFSLLILIHDNFVSINL